MFKVSCLLLCVKKLYEDQHTTQLATYSHPKFLLHVRLQLNKHIRKKSYMVLNVRKYFFQAIQRDLDQSSSLWAVLLGCANKDLWALYAPIFIIVVYCRTVSSYFFFYNNRNSCAKVLKWPYCLAYCVILSRLFVDVVVFVKPYSPGQGYFFITMIVSYMTKPWGKWS